MTSQEEDDYTRLTMKRMLPKVLVAGSLLLLTPLPVLAQGRGQENGARTQVVQASPTGSPLLIATPAPTLNPGKLQACQAKQASIQTRMGSLTRLSANMLNVFSSIAQRVMLFYSAKVLPTGKTVANYDTLVADIQTKSTAVQTALSKAQGDANSFSCQTGNAKAQVTLFRQDMQAVKTALKNYRTSIKNLIVAVRGVAVKGGASASPKATASPTATP